MSKPENSVEYRFNTADLKDKYMFDLPVVKQIEREFGDDYYLFEQEFNNYWEDTLLNQIINQSSGGMGYVAGIGPVDYNESKILYLFIRTKKPKNILEIGFASGCSTAVIGKALEMNGKGKCYTVDVKENPGKAVGDTSDDIWRIDEFSRLVENGTINATFPKNALDYVEEFDRSIEIDMTFTDASHEREFTDPMVKLLKKYYPNALHLYHEWSFSPIATELAQSYLSIPINKNYQAFSERQSFEDFFPHEDYHHYGFYGSCGLGVVKKRNKKEQVKVYYRLSNFEAGISKKKIPNATKQHCLENCIKEFGVDNITIVGDTLNDETKQFVLDKKLRLVEVENGTGSETFKDALYLAIEENQGSDIVYLLEDDFLHKPNSANLIKEGVRKANVYATLYDHPDKYLNADQGGNPAVQMGGEVTRLVKTDSLHWKITNSTVMSFATRVERLEDDLKLLEKHSSNNITNSFGFFTDLLKEKNVGVISSLPGYSTHCEAAWLSPYTNWEKI